MTPINAPIERLQSGSRYAPWMWISLLAVLIALAGGIIAWSWWRGTNRQPAAGQSAPPVLTVFAYVREIQPNDQGAYAAVDPAEWFTGQAASQAAQADNQCSDESTSSLCSLPNGYYIRNSATDTQPLVIDAKATVAMQTLGTDATGNNFLDQPITLNQWIDLFT